jgi:hypothetical protein
MFVVSYFLWIELLPIDCVFPREYTASHPIRYYPPQPQESEIQTNAKCISLSLSHSLSLSLYIYTQYIVLYISIYRGAFYLRKTSVSLLSKCSQCVVNGADINSAR